MKYFNSHTTVLAAVIALLSASPLHAAAVFDPALQPLGSISPLILSNTDLSAGTSKAYRAWFENGGWQGDLVEYDVNTVGAVSTSVDLSGYSPVNTGSPPANWSAHVQFAAAETAAIAAGDEYWHDDRKIITYNAGQVAFRWDQLSSSQKTALDQSAYDNSDTSSDYLDFVRGDRSNETPLGPYRDRVSIFGDLIHSNPVYVGPPKGFFTTGNYASFASTWSTRDKRVYVGGNDGMLHVFDADDGTEAWAYIPSMVIGNLNQMTLRPYTHVYYVDGLLTAQDVYYDSDWHTVLVGGLGAGGKGWYALDITSPTLSDEDSDSGNNAKVLWELSAADSDDMGHSFGQAVIAKLNDGNTYALIGNGYNSANGIAVLYLANIQTGTIDKSITTESGSSSTPNGLSSPTLVDTDGNGTADLVFAGDIDGNMWKFDLSSTNASDWDVAYEVSGVLTPIYAGGSSQPIIQPPDVTLHPLSGHLVMYGTGRLFTADDMSNTDIQALYSIWDTGLAPDEDKDLLVQTLSGDLTYTATDISETVQTIVSSDPVNWNEHRGWKVPLEAGYRVLQPVALRGGRVKVTINAPETRANYILEVAYLDGGSPGTPIFDLNVSGTLDNDDNIDLDGDGDKTSYDDVVVLWGQPAGVMSQVTVARVADGVDAQLLNYVVPPAKLPCTGDCPGGFIGGHVDVDTDSWNGGSDNKEAPVGGKTGKHTHEYDKKTDRVYVDYMDIVIDVGKHAQLDDTDFIAAAQEWIIVVANADLSPGGVLTLDDRTYNVVVYQEMIHRKLRAWNGTDALTDDDGKTLIFSANALAASGGTVKNSFNDAAIIQGGLHPTNTNCVNKADAVTKGRYRNGSLVTQAIKRSMFPGSASNMLDLLTVQNPDDLPDSMVVGDGVTVILKEAGDTSDTSSPAYEVIGGLRATISSSNDDDALFESTLFWHYERKFGDYEDPCYGDDDWAEAVQEVIDLAFLTESEFDLLLTDLGYSRNADDSINCGTCNDKELEALENVESSIGQGFVDSATGLESDGETPVIMEGAAAAQGITVGPNFQTGRRTWTDIVTD